MVHIRRKHKTRRMKMKRALTLAVALLMVVAATASASAEIVNTGVVVMDKADFERIQGLVSGSQNSSGTAPLAQPVVVNTGVVEISAADQTVIEDYVAGRTEFKAAPGKVSEEHLAKSTVVEIDEKDLAGIEQMYRRGLEQRLAYLHTVMQN